MTKLSLPSQVRLRELFDFDADTGHLIRKRRSKHGSEKRLGEPAGYNERRGYRRIRVDGIVYQAHRLVWMYLHGEEPPLYIDHRDGDPSNNRPSNLRLATPRQNLQNTKLPSRNKSGHRGVSWYRAKKKWRADICIDGKRKTLGLFANLQDAIDAYQSASSRAFGDFDATASRT